MTHSSAIPLSYSKSVAISSTKSGTFSTSKNRLLLEQDWADRSEKSFYVKLRNLWHQICLKTQFELWGHYFVVTSNFYCLLLKFTQITYQRQVPIKPNLPQFSSFLSTLKLTISPKKQFFVELDSTPRITLFSKLITEADRTLTFWV